MDVEHSTWGLDTHVLPYAGLDPQDSRFHTSLAGPPLIFGSFTQLLAWTLGDDCVSGLTFWSVSHQQWGPEPWIGQYRVSSPWRSRSPLELAQAAMCLSVVLNTINTVDSQLTSSHRDW